MFLYIPLSPDQESRGGRVCVKTECSVVPEPRAEAISLLSQQSQQAPL